METRSGKPGPPIPATNSAWGRGVEQGDRHGKVVHQTSKGSTLFVHINKDLTQTTVFELAGAQVNIVTTHVGLLGIPGKTTVPTLIKFTVYPTSYYEKVTILMPMVYFQFSQSLFMYLFWTKKDQKCPLLL